MMSLHRPSFLTHISVPPSTLSTLIITLSTSDLYILLDTVLTFELGLTSVLIVSCVLSFVVVILYMWNVVVSVRFKLSRFWFVAALGKGPKP